MRSLVISLLVVFCVGCTPHRPLTTLNIDPYFSDIETQWIREAAAEWQREVPFEIVENSTSKKGGWIGPEKRAKCDRRPDKDGFSYLFPQRSPRIRICVGRVKNREDAFKYIVAHELGHALAGRDGHLDGSALMSEDYVGLESPTNRDFDYVYGIDN